jgi:hypothetical protein
MCCMRRNCWTGLARRDVYCMCTVCVYITRTSSCFCMAAALKGKGCKAGIMHTCCSLYCGAPAAYPEAGGVHDLHCLLSIRIWKVLRAVCRGHCMRSQHTKHQQHESQQAQQLPMLSVEYLKLCSGTVVPTAGTCCKQALGATWKRTSSYEQF